LNTPNNLLWHTCALLFPDKYHSLENLSLMVI
jgi:hypothetical protein